MTKSTQCMINVLLGLLLIFVDLFDVLQKIVKVKHEERHRVLLLAVHKPGFTTLTHLPICDKYEIKYAYR